MITSYMNYGALYAKVRSLYGKRLRFEDFQHMASLPGEADILNYLRSQPGWAAAAAALDATTFVGRVELEESLRQELFREYEGLCHFVPKDDKALVSFPSRLAELEDILAALRRLKAGGHARPLPEYRYAPNVKVDRAALSVCKDYGALLDAAKGSVYYAPLLHVKPAAHGGLPDYATTEAILRATYFSTMYRAIHSQRSADTRKVLLRAFGEQVDLLNIIHILRLKTYFPGDDQFFSVLLPFHYRLKGDKIKALCAAHDAAEVFSLLQDTPYAKHFEGVAVTEVEDYYRRAFYAFNRRVLVTGEPSVYTAMAYLNMKELEFDVLVNVIESVKYGAPYDEAFARLVGQ